jgi:hypothetical protein
MRRFRNLAIFILPVFFCTPLAAKYLVDGEIKGQVCTSYVVVSSCEMVSIEAVEGDDGQLFAIKQEYESVSEFNESTGRCWIRLDISPSWLWRIKRKLAGPQFFTKNRDGQYKKVNPEYVTFRCKKVN